MKTARRSLPAAAPGRPAAPPRRARSPRPRPAPGLPFRSPEQRRWFDAEVAAFSRHVHTARLGGDFVAAQRLERELSSFTKATRQLLEGSGGGYEAVHDEQGEKVYSPDDGADGDANGGANSSANDSADGGAAVGTT